MSVIAPTKLNTICLPGETLMGKTREETYDLLKVMTNNNYQRLTKSVPTWQEVVVIHSVVAVIALSTKMDALLRKMNLLKAQGAAPIRYDFNEEGPLLNPMQGTKEEPNYIGENLRNGLYSNTYILSWINHHKISYSNNKANPLTRFQNAQKQLQQAIDQSCKLE